MKKLLLAAVCLIVLSSCGVSYTSISIEKMDKSPSGIDFRSKTCAACFAYNNAVDSTALLKYMQRLCGKLSNDYQMDVNIYAFPRESSVDYSSQASMVSLITAYNVDVVLLGVKDDETKLYVYDSQSAEDKTFDIVAETAMSHLAPLWSKYELKLLYYLNSQKWETAVSYVEAFKLPQAIETWCNILESEKDLSHRHAAEYNIASCCYVLGQIKLAKQWYDRAAADYMSADLPSYMRSLKRKLN